MCGHRLPGSFQRDSIGNREMAGKKEVAGSGEYGSAADLACLIEGLLKGRRIVGLAISPGSVGPYLEGSR